MSPRAPRNLAASVRARLYRVAQERGEDFQLVLTRYGLERLLYRLGVSPYRDRFILKGAMLFSLWSADLHRATRDIDLLGFVDNTPETLEGIFRDVCTQSVPSDGLSFLEDTVRAELIAEQTEYGGIRVRLEARLANARIPIQADVGIGDVVTPAPEIIEYPTLLENPKPRLRSYPRETVIAEKFESIVRLGMANSRMKDFYDLWVLRQKFEFSGETLARAIRSTFARRDTALPQTVPRGLSDEFASDAQSRARWNAFLKTRGLSTDELSLADVCRSLRQFLMPLSGALAQNLSFDAVWPPAGPWQSRG